MYFVYVLTSLEFNYLYVGITKEIDNRFIRHNTGRERTTRFYKPFKLLFIISTENRPEARLLEIYFKSGVGKEFLKNLT